MNLPAVVNNPSHLAEALTVLMNRGDFIAIGNLMLELLMRPGQEAYPDEATRFLGFNLRAIVAHRFCIDEWLSYGMPHRDQHLNYQLRGDWKADIFPQLIITAYLLGATRTNLPPPHDKLVPYYTLAAKQQSQLIRKADNTHRKWVALAHERGITLALPDSTKKEKGGPDKEERRRQLIAERDAQIAAVRNSGMERLLIEAEVQHITREYDKKLKALEGS